MTPEPATIETWLLAKRQELQARRFLEQHQAVRDHLLVDTSWDAAASALGLELCRPARDSYRYKNDRALARLLERQETLRTQVLEKQAAFRQDCLEGRRQVGLDFTPARGLTVQLLAVDADPMMINTPSPAPGSRTPQQTRARTERRPPEVRVATRRAFRPWLGNAVRASNP